MTLVSRHSSLSLAFFSFMVIVSVSEGLLSSQSETLQPLSTVTSLPFFFRPSIPSSSSCSALFASSVSSQQSRKKKGKTNNNDKNKKKTGKGSAHSNTRRKSGPGKSLSEEELSDHVSARYITDRRSVMALEDREGDEEDSASLMEVAEQDKFLKELNRRPALVLNADFQPLCYLPLSLWSWQDAVKAIFNGKVQVVDVYPDISVRAANLEVPLPSVIALSDYVAHKNQRPAFTRRNVFLRDEYKCQYCNDRFHTADLSLDHVTPRCRGGQLSWENAVTSCLKCNGRKGSTPVTQLRSVGMRLIREPRCPSQMELAAKAARMVPRRVHPTWKPFLGIAETPKNSPSAQKRTGDEEFIDDRYFEESD